MSFGLCNASIYFMHMMNGVFHLIIDYCVLIYLDDILIVSTIWEE
jgi:hypothetical protein